MSCSHCCFPPGSTRRYSIAVIDRSNGSAPPVDSVDQLLGERRDFLRIEDLLITPLDR
jgi:hypothetical protein